MQPTANSAQLLNLIWKSWKICGADVYRVKRRVPYIIYSTFLQVVVTFCYPLHLLLVSFRLDTPGENIKSFAICLTCTSCSLKFLSFFSKIKKMESVKNLLNQMDSRILSQKESFMFEEIRSNVRKTMYIFCAFYSAVGILAAAMFFLTPGHHLLYPAWFPFDWEKSFFYYIAASVYQIIGISYLIMQNFANDLFPAATLCLLSGHANLLALRISEIGHDDQNLQENEEQLLLCIQDQQNLYKLFDVVQKLISFPMFVQITTAAVSLCVSVASFLFFSETLVERIYYFIYGLAMPLQIFPSCYFGSDLEIYFEHLHYAAFCSNWPMQTPHYKKHLIFFIERSLKKTSAMAGGVLKIHLDTFFATCKSGYSLFTVILGMK